LTLWTFSINSPLAIFAGIVSILGSFGIFMTRLLSGSESVGKRVLKELEEEAVSDRERALDDLDHKLAADDDPRTEKSLRDLRTLAHAFQEDQAWLSALNTRSTFDILAGVEQLFTRCVLSLEKTLKLWYTARDMTSLEAREAILNLRERIIEDVSKSTIQLGRILAGIQSISVQDGDDDSELAHIRAELDRSLEVAKMVEKRMQSLDRELDIDS